MTHTETVRLTADLALFHQDADGVLHVLTIRRGHPPGKGRRALPGGHVDPGEGSDEAALRECGEETSIDLWGLMTAGRTSGLIKVGTFDSPGRDPRGRFVTTAYAIAVDHMVIPTAADDAATAEWVRVDELLVDREPMACDHRVIVANAAEAIRQKITGHETEAAATVTVDAVLFHRGENDATNVLLVERSQPVRGQLANPGGFVGVGEEPNDAVRRKLAEKTGIRAPAGLTLVGVRGHPGTDPMDEVVKLVYAAVVDTMPEPVAGYDAIGARWIKVTPDLLKPGTLAFDHAELLMIAFRWAQERLR